MIFLGHDTQSTSKKIEKKKKCHKFFWLGKIHKFSNIYIYIYIIHAIYMNICMYIKTLLLLLIKAWERTTSKREREIEKQTKWNGSTECEIEKVKQTRKNKKIII